MSDDYMERQRRRLRAEGRLYEAAHFEFIALRAFIVTGAEPHTHGIALPDGRLIVGGHATFSSERALKKLYPGAAIIWAPDVDETINRVMPEDDES